MAVDPQSREPKTEQYLKRGGYRYRLEEIPIAEIDYEASRDNPARLSRRLDTERVTQYGCEMIDGVIFPAIVLLNLEDPHDGKLWIVSTGMHRLSAGIEAKKTTIAAYVVTEADHYRREALTRLINGIEGRGLTMQEQIGQVLILKETYQSKSINDLAKTANIPPSTLQTAYNEQKTKERARRFNVDLERVKTPQKTIVALGNIHSDRVFEPAIKLVHDVGNNGISAAEVKEMVGEVKKMRDEKSQLDVVQRYRTAAENKLERTRARTHKIKPAKANQVVYDMRRLLKNFDVSLDDLHIAALPQLDAAEAIAVGVVEHMKRWIAEVQRVKRMQHPPPDRSAAD